MDRFTLSTVFALAVITSILAGGTVLAENSPRYEVTVTNLTRGQQFTPILVASHKGGVSLFKAGDPASPELAILAEEGNTAPLTALLSGMPEVRDVASSSGLLDPGKSVSVIVEMGGAFNHISVAAMLIPNQR